MEFPSWNRIAPVPRAARGELSRSFLLPLTRVFAWIKVEGLRTSGNVEGPVIFAANHQSHMDVPVILAALPGKWRRRVAPAMAKEFFKAHFFPGELHARQAVHATASNYWLSAAFFNTFPLPQREAGARQTLRYAGELLSDGFSVLIFPEGKRTEHGEISHRSGPASAMMASRLGVPVVSRPAGRRRSRAPPAHGRWPNPAACACTFGAPMQLSGEDYVDLAARVEDAVRKLGGMSSVYGTIIASDQGPRAIA